MGKVSKDLNTSKKINLPEGITWDELTNALSREDNQAFLDSIDPETYRQILDERNHLKLKRRFIKALRKSDPENATTDYVEKMLEVIKQLAKAYLDKNKHDNKR